MALSGKVFTIQGRESNGTTSETTGFEPKVILAWAPPGVNALNTAEGATTGMNVGAGAGPTAAQCHAAGGALYGMSGSSVPHYRGLNSTSRLLNNAISTSDAAPYLTWSAADATSATFTHAGTATGTNFYFTALALGGADVTHAAVGQIACGTSTGNQSYTGVGFQPDAVLFFTGRFTTTLGDVSSPTNTNASHSLGWMSAAGQGVCAMRWTDAPSGNVTYGKRYQSTSYCTAMLAGDGTYTFLGSYVSMDADGFTLNWGDAAGSAYKIMYLAMKGVSVAAGSFSQPATDTTVQVSGLSFTPKVVLLQSANHTSSASQTADWRWSVGAMTASEQMCGWAGAQDAIDTDSANANGTVYLANAAALRLMTPGDALTPTTQGIATYSSMTSGEFTTAWTSTDGTQREILYLALGDAPAAGQPRLARNPNHIYPPARGRTGHWF